jgi:hypothetical protein
MERQGTGKSVGNWSVLWPGLVVCLNSHAYWKMDFTAFISTLILGYDRKGEVKEDTNTGDSVIEHGVASAAKGRL